MGYSELLLLLASGFFSFKFIADWYRAVLGSVHMRRGIFPRTVLFFLPVFAFVIITYTLVSLASFDVVGSSFYILFYLLIGFAWLHFGMRYMFYFFDLSWLDDVIGMNNPAAALAVFGGGIGITLIYAGANIGDGPGWFCVFFAGGLGIAAWFLLALLADRVSNLFRRITVQRDIPCGIRTGAYLLASGVIFGRASAGDWTSFSQTVIEFCDGWPALILAAVFLLIEFAFIPLQHWERDGGKYMKWFLSILFGAAFIAFAVYALQILPPLPVNPMY